MIKYFERIEKVINLIAVAAIIAVLLLLVFSFFGFTKVYYSIGLRFIIFAAFVFFGYKVIILILS